ncbi:hypothetical protein LCGC14_1873970 [marine sediment metagenome]|uniref:Uncharacterized protein n=1 Tax=marine sediment metagenome TaxID=412755 RepID=A0A0F9GS94_9ZZZZ
MTCKHTHKDDPENAVCEDCYVAGSDELKQNIREINDSLKTISRAMWSWAYSKNLPGFEGS